MWLAEGRLWMYARCCSRLIVLRVRLIRGAPRAGVSPWVQGLRLSRRSLLRLAGAPTGRTAPSPRLWAAEASVTVWGKLPVRRLAGSADEPAEQSAVRHAEHETDAGGTETQDQTEALP